MQDRELLELAAKAAGLSVNVKAQAERDARGYGTAGLYIKNGSTCWNPLTDQGDALRLAVKLKMEISITDNHAWAMALGTPGGGSAEFVKDNANASTCRAIVRAAAEIDKQALERATMSMRLKRTIFNWRWWLVLPAFAVLFPLAIASFLAAKIAPITSRLMAWTRAA